MKSAIRAGRFFLILLTAARWACAGDITLPSGTRLHVILETTLSTKNSKAGDLFRARMVLPLFYNEREVLPVGTAVQGTVASVQGPGRVKGKAEMQLRPEKLYLPDGRDILITASLEGAKTEDGVRLDSKEGTIQQSGKDGMNGKKVATGIGMGAGVGAATGGAMGAAIGAGAAGTIFVLQQIFKKGKDAVLPAGSELDLEVKRPFSFSDMQELPPRTRTSEERNIPSGPIILPSRELDGQR